MPNTIRHIAFAGAGNVAWHLAHGLKQKGYTISSIWSRTHEHAAELAESVGAEAAESVSDLRCDSDLIVIAVSDDAISSMAERIGGYDGILAHTAGSVGMEVLKAVTAKCGVLYPLQTFSKHTPVELAEVPFFIEAANTPVKSLLETVARSLSESVYEVDSETRLKIHVAAVFANNYSNLMFTIANELLAANNLDKSILDSLIRETLRKAKSGNPAKSQTGPARRGDISTIYKHITALADKPGVAKLYRQLADFIIHKYNKTI